MGHHPWLIIAAILGLPAGSFLVLWCWHALRRSSSRGSPWSTLKSLLASRCSEEPPPRPSAPQEATSSAGPPATENHHAECRHYNAGQCLGTAAERAWLAEASRVWPAVGPGQIPQV